MLVGMIRTLLLSAALALPAAAPPAPSPRTLAFDSFIAASAPICLHQPSRRCVDAGFGFADADGDGKLSLAELKAVRADLDSWLAWRGPTLRPQERGAVLFGAQLVDAIGLERLLDSYDEDRDGLVSRAELLADVRLDHRPLAEVLADENALDRRALQRRLGALAPAVDGMLRRTR